MTIAYLNNATLNDFRAGDRVEIHPATDLWMRGARYATVMSVGKKNLRIRLEPKGRTMLIMPGSIGAIMDKDADYHVAPRNPPYPFCHHPEKCITTGRCMAEFCCAD